ncbi:MAG: hypothetical protein KF819_30070 [Labilithrix sp.]|nr:hypothetical protein [Labilithrix sp.]
MRKLRVVFLASAAAGMLAAACGDDDNVVRNRPDGGVVDAGPIDAAPDAANPCDITLPPTYDSPGYDTNAAVELGLRNKLDAFLKPMRDAENDFADGGAPAPVTKAQLVTLYTDGNPNIKGITTVFYQPKVDAWFGEYEEAFTAGPFTPTDPPPAKGGTYGKWVMSARAVDLHQAIEKGTYVAGFYNHALGVLSSGPITEATIDRLIAAFGAHPSFPGDPAALQNKDVNSAALAARRSRDPALTGPYVKMKQAAIKAKASIAAGAKCAADRDAAIKTFLSEWERSSYATVIFDFNDIIADKLSPGKFAEALHAYGEGIGLIAGFRTIPQDRRIVTDAQIDKMLSDALSPVTAASEAFKLQTASVQAAAGLQQVMSDIKTIYGFSDAEIASFKKFD